jgi:SAM-dependent methyltransferase
MIYLAILVGIILSACVLLQWLFVVPAFLCFLIAAYFAYARYSFSPKGGKVQTKIWETAITNLAWDGEGKALDIGCGNGALTIILAKKFPSATVTGIDFWGDRWEYSKNTCEANAKVEGVDGRVEFRKASASKLPFVDEYFDAAVSNFCFHEVVDSNDKREVIREALRVVRKGGKFAFQDLFLLKKVYGTPEELVSVIESWGIAEVEFIETRNEPFVPAVLKLPFMLGRIAIIRGQK